MNNEATDEINETVQIPTEENPWWMLANFYGNPESENDGKIEDNRVFWNQIIFSCLPVETAKTLSGHFKPRSTPPHSHILSDLETCWDKAQHERFPCFKAFLEDYRNRKFSLPDISFANTEMGNVYFNRYYFPTNVDFTGAQISGEAFFSGSLFDQNVTFDKSQFIKRALFEGTRFRGRTTFSKIYLGDTLEFPKATFENRINIFAHIKLKDNNPENIDRVYSTFFQETSIKFLSLQNLSFHRQIPFFRCQDLEHLSLAHVDFIEDFQFTAHKFSYEVNISNVTFHKNFMFPGILFNSAVTFSETEFKGNAVFSRTEFSKRPIFNRCVFSQSYQPFSPQVPSAIFVGTQFLNGVDFEQTEFNRVNFNNSVFSGTASFFKVTFNVPPKFHGSTFHPDTNWKVRKWPDYPPHPSGFLNYLKQRWYGLRSFLLLIANKTMDADVSEQKEADEWENSWSTLKLHMNGQHKYDLENLFFSKELDVKRWILAHTGGSFRQRFSTNIQRIAFWFYGSWSGYGQSIILPFAWLIILALLFGLSFAAIEVETSFREAWQQGTLCFDIERGFKLSFANMLPFLGMQKLVLSGTTSTGIFVFSALQSTLSLVLLFLLGLGLRNKFRIK